MRRPGAARRRHPATTVRRTSTSSPAAAAVFPGVLLFALVLALRSCTSCIGATVSTSWPFKVHGIAVDDITADREEGGQSAGGAGADPPAEILSDGPNAHLGVPGTPEYVHSKLHALLLRSTVFLSSSVLYEVYILYTTTHTHNTYIHNVHYCCTAVPLSFFTSKYCFLPQDINVFASL